jgi:CAAX protease family protein
MMNKIKLAITSHAVPVYFALTFAISWGGLLALGGLSRLSSDTWQSDPRLPWFGLAMLAGPSAAGLLLTSIVSGRAGLRQLLSRMFRWRVSARWYAVALLTAPIVFASVHFLLSLASPLFLPSIVTTSNRMPLLMSSIAAALTVGVFEEIGWTGFAIPTLRQRHAAFAAAIIVGAPWGAWHLLTNDFWIATTYAGELSVPVFAIVTGVTLVVGQLPAYRVLMVWVYDRTGSLLIAMLMHASLSACSFILGPEKVTGVALVSYGFALTAAWWIVVAVIAITRRKQISRQPFDVTPRRHAA